MKILHRKPGVILLPVFAVFIIFILLLTLLIGQKRSNNALVLEYQASRVINLLIDLYAADQNINPAVIDENILGFGLYDEKQQPVFRYGSAPERLPAQNKYNDVLFSDNRSIVVVRGGAAGMLQRMPPNMQRRFNESRDSRSNGNAGPMMLKYQSGVYLEYRNTAYLTERRLIALIVFLFTVFFTVAVVLIFRLYQSNRRLLVKTEHDKQLIQLGEAARTLAHEIRNPLGALKIQRDLLFRKLPEEYSGNLDVIDRELKRLNTLVERVGEFLRNPLGNPDCINLYDFIFQLYGSRKDVVIRGERNLDILFDRERLRTVMDNLINNAVESAGNAEVVVFGGKRSGFEVMDSGSGFSEDDLPRLFDPFFTTKNNGTGLGLSVVARLVDAAGGSITAANRREGGARLTVEFGDRNESINC